MTSLEWKLVAILLRKSVDALAVVAGEEAVNVAMEVVAVVTVAEVVEEVATHTLVRLSLQRPLPAVLNELERAGSPVAGADPRTRRFFRQRVGLTRPFVHVEVAQDGQRTVRAPLHGDLQEALYTLRRGAAKRSKRGVARRGRRPTAGRKRRG